VIVAVCELVIVFAVAWKVWVALPALTVTEAGTVNKAVALSERLTTVPPVGAARDSVTVQLDVAPADRVVGVHESAETVGRTLIVPPAVPTMSASVPSGKAPNTLLMVRVSRVLVLAGDRVAVTTATTPLPTAVAFMPDATQVTVPLPGLQFSVFPAAVSAEPTVALSEVIAVVE
jgi:hypothetical protein